MKLEKKVRVKGKIHRKYDVAKTPYKRMMESDQVSTEVKEKLKEVYDSLNPALLKRQINVKIKRLYEVYKKIRECYILMYLTYQLPASNHLK